MNDIFTSQKCTRLTIAIVDGYLSGAQIARTALAKGWKCIHVQSSKELPPFLTDTFSRELFKETYIFDSNLESLVADLKRHDVAFILPGAETGVALCELLSAALGLAGNDPNSIQFRRNKFSMIDALSKDGLLTANQFLIGSNSNTEAELRKRNLGWPVVVKPINSAGTDGISFCFNETETAYAVAKLLNRKNAIGYLNDFVVVQSFLEGTEYAVNMISWGSHQEVTDIWRYHKRTVPGAGAIYDWQELIDINSSEAAPLIEYLSNALPILGLNHGPSHNEVMMTAKGPALVELGSRLQGSINTEILDACTGTNQLDRTLRLFADPQLYISTYTKPHELKKKCFWIEMIAEKDTIAHDLESFKHEVMALQSFHSIRLRTKSGKPISKTVDLLTSPGVLYLSHQSQPQLESDYQSYRGIERRFFS